MTVFRCKTCGAVYEHEILHKQCQNCYQFSIEVVKVL